MLILFPHLRIPKFKSTQDKIITFMFFGEMKVLEKCRKSACKTKYRTLDVAEYYYLCLTILTYSISPDYSISQDVRFRKILLFPLQSGEIEYLAKSNQPKYTV